MKTPILDFVREYEKNDTVRFHMPGHKGIGPLGIETLDITEIDGADVLYAPNGIIAESEENATALFGAAHTFFSTEGSSLSIKAMLAIACPVGSRVLAARNAHKSFLYAAAILDLSVDWLYPNGDAHVCTSQITPALLEESLSSTEKLPSAVYITSPDYLGNIADIEQLSKVCKHYGVPLLVDNAHGAYLAFLSPSRHPIALGASMVCDSAHKTLPTLTGGAYLHIAKSAPEAYLSRAREMLSMFASSSPSYLILASLDATNEYLKGQMKKQLKAVIGQAECLKKELCERGFSLCGNEPMKVTLYAPDYGYFGYEIAKHLNKCGIVAEFYDKEYLVLMLSSQTKEEDMLRLKDALFSLPKKQRLALHAPTISPRVQKTSIRHALFAPSRCVNASDAIGKICATPALSTPPCIPLAVSGELITEDAAEALLYYGITRLNIIEE